MITLSSLHQSLSEIFFDKDKDDFETMKKFVVPLQGNWWVPTMDTSLTSSTWIGFMVTSTLPKQRARREGRLVVKPVRQNFRITLIGPQAEEWAHTTLLWDEREDVREVFARTSRAQLCYDERHIYTKIYEQEGQNSTIIQVIDMSAFSSFVFDTHQKPWVPIGDGGIITIP